jgi:hypothetical protein
MSMGKDSYKPPAAARSAARTGLRLRKKWKRGGTAVGVARARDLSNGRNVSRETVARMSSFNRHRANATNGRKHADGGPTAARIAWLLWGGSAGVDWARGIMQSQKALQTATKPFVSKRQQRWAFATGQPFADEWSDETGDTSAFRRLPERKRKSRSAQRRTDKAKEKPTGGGGGGCGSDAAEERRLKLIQQIRDTLKRSLGKAQKADLPGGFMVYKAANGASRWISFSSNAYGPDGDDQTVSLKALDQDVKRTADTGLYGPLRFWHLGNPNPLNIDEPWGAGLDIGWCDFAAMHGPLLVESGTFINEQMARAFKAKAHLLAPSIGFFHPRTEPDSEGVFHNIWRFERSAAPKDRVTNKLARFALPEENMNPTQLKAFVDLFGGAVDEETIQALLDKAEQQTEKAASQMGLALKAQPSAERKVYSVEGQPHIIQDGKLVALKAMDETEKGEGYETATKPEVEMEENAEPEAEAADAGMAEGDGEYVGDMSPDAFKTMLAEALAGALDPLLKKLDIAGKMEGVMKGLQEEMKGYTQGLKATEATGQDVEALKARIAELEGSQGELAALKAQLELVTQEQPAGVQSNKPVALQPVDAATTEKSSNGNTGPFVDNIASWIRGEMELPVVGEN